MTIDRKILIGLVTVLLLAPQYHGYKALGDVFATWKNDGVDVEEVRFYERCSQIKSIGELKIMKGLK